jgi:hypothetical protein
MGICIIYSSKKDIFVTRVSYTVIKQCRRALGSIKVAFFPQHDSRLPTLRIVSSNPQFTYIGFSADRSKLHI